MLLEVNFNQLTMKLIPKEIVSNCSRDGVACVLTCKLLQRLNAHTRELSLEHGRLEALEI